MIDLLKPRIILFLACFGLFSCNEDNERPSLRTRIDYATLTPETPYSTLFVDASGVTTVDLIEGNHRLQMFQSLDYYIKSSVAAGTPIDGITLKNMFANTGDPFTDIATTTVTVDGAELNNSAVQIRNVVASSLQTDDAEGVRSKLESYFSVIDAISESMDQTASAGVAGKLDNYLVDQKGIEIAQVIQKSLIGSLQLDYIGNVLLDEGLDADNFQTVGDNNFTQLEHNWDEAYGLLTLNPIYLEGATDAARNTNEFGLGSYVWEYNKANYAKIYSSFLQGRAAIVNNDKEQYQALATFIRTEFEKAIARAAVGYLDKWKKGQTDATRAHAIGEAVGFIYSLRFAEMHGANAAFSDEILKDFLETGSGFWELDAETINGALETITTKFDL